MNKKILFYALMLLPCSYLFAQKNESSKIDQFVDVAATIGNSQQSFAASYVYNWRLGKKKKWELGTGFRITSTSGHNLNYITAGPASITRGTDIPFLVVVSSQKTENWDTLTVQNPFTTSLNASFNLGYNFTKKLFGGCNIDVVGFTVGQHTSATLTDKGNSIIEPIAKPTAFNLLLTGDNDLGSLNSEFFLKYRLKNHFSLRAVYQFLFTEYRTTTIHQTTSDGTKIDRFRNKANNFGIGVSYNL